MRAGMLINSSSGNLEQQDSDTSAPAAARSRPGERHGLEPHAVGGHQLPVVEHQAATREEAVVYHHCEYENRLNNHNRRS